MHPSLYFGSAVKRPKTGLWFARRQSQPSLVLIHFIVDRLAIVDLVAFEFSLDFHEGIVKHQAAIKEGAFAGSINPLPQEPGLSQPWQPSSP